MTLFDVVSHNIINESIEINERNVLELLHNVVLSH